MLRSRLSLLLANALQLLFFLAPLADAQYIQRWRWETINGVEVPTWRPTVGEASRPVIMLDTDEAVYLEYNCFYLRAICQNARQYLISALSKERQWRTAFTYDLNRVRGDQGRRRQVCQWVEGGNGVQEPEPAPSEGRGEVAYSRCTPAREFLRSSNVIGRAGIVSW